VCPRRVEDGEAVADVVALAQAAGDDARAAAWTFMSTRPMPSGGRFGVAC
jgi:hypothetical protein